MTYYAHSLEDQPIEKWQKLDEHLENVAELAAEFASAFDAEDWAMLAGRFHDTGKYSDAFQAFLRNENSLMDEFAEYYKGRVDHSSCGAQKVYACSKQGGKLLAYVLAGHHSGLPDWSLDAMHGLKYRLDKSIEHITKEFEDIVVPEKLPISVDKDRFGFQVQFFVRMLFSCLVDADYLDTEGFMQPQKAVFREKILTLSDLYISFWKKFNDFQMEADDTHVNRIRKKVLDDCLRASEMPPGIFSLTVPTGGGKTLSSLAFALRHAERYQKKRIIYVIPFTSIIEQNAQVFRRFLKEEAVLEHHSNFVPDQSDWVTRLSTENWNAPVVVTTNVQFFDSFFANRTSKCRKLHNVADSIIIFDEVQVIPVERLKPCIEVIKELSLNYNVTSVLCTATQPAITESREFRDGISDVREVIQNVGDLFKDLERTRVSFCGKRKMESIAEQVCENRQVLSIVNTRKAARELYAMIKNNGDAFHLSASMYPSHRVKMLSDIKKRLEAGEKCRVVSTQLIEAGIDIDFPVVFRSITGMDSVAQAAGRCNREGRQERGNVYVYEPDQGVPPGYFRQTAQCAQSLFKKYPDSLLLPECINEYFLNYFWIQQDRMDKKEILDICKRAVKGNIDFEKLSEFRMIDNPAEPVIVALEEEPEKLLEQLLYVKHSVQIHRKLQRYAVNIYPYELKRIAAYLQEPLPGVRVLRSRTMYSDEFGIITDIEGDQSDDVYIC